MEKALVFIKPEFIWNRREIWDYLDVALEANLGRDFERTAGELIRVPREILAVHYVNIRDSYPIPYRSALDTMSGKLISVRLYLGPENLVRSLRWVVGNTDPVGAGIATIRRMFSDDSLERSRAEGRAVKNVMHASSDSLVGESEVIRFTPFLGEVLYIPFSVQKYVRSRIAGTCRQF